MPSIAAKVTLNKIRRLEKQRKVSFIEGMERYMLGSSEDREDFFMYYALFKELEKVEGATADV